VAVTQADQLFAALAMATESPLEEEDAATAAA
jgi:hypothetical protein